MDGRKAKVLFVGAGRMAQAMISGLVKGRQFSVTVGNSQDAKKLKQVEHLFDVKGTRQWREEVSNHDVIVLAMPPDAHKEVLEELAGQINGQLVITVAAGIGPSYLEQQLPSGTPVAWAMPNTAADLGKSMTLYALGKHTGEKEQEIVEKLLSGIGAYERVTEEQLHSLTAITGSAPAFIYELAAILEKLALETGVSSDQARNMVSNMIDGAASMLKTGKDPAQLSYQVATPGGSTAAGLEVFKQHNTEELIKEAIEACREKSRQKE